jgi:hypothetical protein
MSSNEILSPELIKKISDGYQMALEAAELAGRDCAVALRGGRCCGTCCERGEDGIYFVTVGRKVIEAPGVLCKRTGQLKKKASICESYQED